MSSMSNRSHALIQQQLSDLSSLPRIELVERWQKAHGCPPPKGIKNDLLILSAAWHLQVKRLGGLKGEAKRQLNRLIKTRLPSPTHSGSSFVSGGLRGQSPASDNNTSDMSTHGNWPPANPSRPTPVIPITRSTLCVGTRLVREWNGRMHVVEVIEGRFSHDGKTYRSLSAIAKKITNAHWSGPRFFGL